MCELDRQLEKLILIAQKHPPKSVARQLVLTQLVQMLPQDALVCANRYYLADEIHQDILEEARQQVLLEVFTKIEEFDPKKGSPIRWMNFLLKKRYNLYRLTYLGIKKVQRNQQKQLIYTQLWETPSELPQPESNTDSEDLKTLIEEDPGQQLQQIHLLDILPPLMLRI